MHAGTDALHDEVAVSAIEKGGVTGLVTPPLQRYVQEGSISSQFPDAMEGIDVVGLSSIR
jgi:hypothetical protein